HAHRDSHWRVTVRRVNKDYTAMAVGAVIDGGEIQTCTYCSRPGLSLQKNGLTVFYHSQWLEKEFERVSSRLGIGPARPASSQHFESSQKGKEHVKANRKS